MPRNEGYNIEGDDEDRDERDEREDRSACKSLCRCCLGALTSTAFLVVLCSAYVILGALLFFAIEAPNEESRQSSLNKERNSLPTKFGNINLKNEKKFNKEASKVLSRYEEELADFYRKRSQSEDGAAGTNITAKQWTAFGSIIYSTSIVTTIGWGNIAPTTLLGRIITIFYGLIGLPLLFVCTSGIGTFINHILFIIWVQIRKISGERIVYKKKKPTKKKAASISSGDSEDDDDDSDDDDDTDDDDDENKNKLIDDLLHPRLMKKRSSFTKTDFSENRGNVPLVKPPCGDSIFIPLEMKDKYESCCQQSNYLKSIRSTLDFIIDMSEDCSKVTSNRPHFRISNQEDASRLCQLILDLPESSRLSCLQFCQLKNPKRTNEHFNKNEFWNYRKSKIKSHENFADSSRSNTFAHRPNGSDKTVIKTIDKTEHPCWQIKNKLNVTKNRDRDLNLDVRNLISFPSHETIVFDRFSKLYLPSSSKSFDYKIRRPKNEYSDQSLCTTSKVTTFQSTASTHNICNPLFLKEMKQISNKNRSYESTMDPLDDREKNLRISVQTKAERTNADFSDLSFRQKCGAGDETVKVKLSCNSKIDDKTKYFASLFQKVLEIEQRGFDYKLENENKLQTGREENCFSDKESCNILFKSQSFASLKRDNKCEILRPHEVESKTIKTKQQKRIARVQEWLNDSVHYGYRGTGIAAAIKRRHKVSKNTESIKSSKHKRSNQNEGTELSLISNFTKQDKKLYKRRLKNNSEVGTPKCYKNIKAESSKHASSDKNEEIKHINSYTTVCKSRVSDPNTSLFIGNLARETRPEFNVNWSYKKGDNTNNNMDSEDGSYQRDGYHFFRSKYYLARNYQEVVEDEEILEEESQEEEWSLISLFLILTIFIFCGSAYFSKEVNENFPDGVYFLYITLSTTGFGDILPPPHTYIVLLFYGFIGISLFNKMVNNMIYIVYDALDKVNKIGKPDNAD